MSNISTTSNSTSKVDQDTVETMHEDHAARRQATEPSASEDPDHKYSDEELLHLLREKKVTGGSTASPIKEVQAEIEMHPISLLTAVGVKVCERKLLRDRYYFFSQTRYPNNAGLTRDRSTSNGLYGWSQGGGKTSVVDSQKLTLELPILGVRRKFTFVEKPSKKRKSKRLVVVGSNAYYFRLDELAISEDEEQEKITISRRQTPLSFLCVYRLIPSMQRLIVTGDEEHEDLKPDFGPEAENGPFMVQSSPQKHLVGELDLKSLPARSAECLGLSADSIMQSQTIQTEHGDLGLQHQNNPMTVNNSGQKQVSEPDLQALPSGSSEDWLGNPPGGQERSPADLLVSLSAQSVSSPDSQPGPSPVVPVNDLNSTAIQHVSAPAVVTPASVELNADSYLESVPSAELSPQPLSVGRMDPELPGIIATQVSHQSSLQYISGNLGAVDPSRGTENENSPLNSEDSSKALSITTIEANETDLDYNSHEVFYSPLEWSCPKLFHIPGHSERYDRHWIGPFKTS